MEEALDAGGINLSLWRIRRKIGMSGGLLTNQLLREVEITAELVARLRWRHLEAYKAKAAGDPERASKGS